MSDRSLFVLRANPIFASKEVLVPICLGHSIEDLKKWVEDQRVETYRESIPAPAGEKTFFKSFKKGSKMENFNVPSEENYSPCPTLKEALQREELMYRKWFDKLDKAGVVTI